MVLLKVGKDAEGGGWLEGGMVDGKREVRRADDGSEGNKEK